MKPFRISIADEQIEDLKKRVRQARWPGSIFQSGDEDGVGLALLQKLATRWSDEFDWRAREAQLNDLPQFTVDIDGQDIHFIHKKGVGPNARPLILTHGWPGSFVEFERVIPLLTDPATARSRSRSLRWRRCAGPGSDRSGRGCDRRGHRSYRAGSPSGNR